jgi:anti-sigma factor RsiW
MRHIPEDELHAYLDQGLSRSQCVEIESHLAGCSSCRATRDGIAALRDRTTALLSKLAPSRRFPPAFDTLRGLAAQRMHTRRRRLRFAAWAASLLAALGLGWSASTIVGPGRTSVATRTLPPAAEAPAVETKSPASAPAPVAATPISVRSEARRQAAPARTAARAAREDSIRQDSIRAARLALLDPAPALELEPVDDRRPAGEQFAGMWRTMSWDGAQSESGQSPPHIEGLPVLRVQVQANDHGKRPLMVVAQQLASGQVIQTIEGPATDVSQLLSRRTTTSSGNGLSVTVSDAASAADQAMAMQLGDRMLAITGALPSDSLRAMIRRINAEMRSK